MVRLGRQTVDDGSNPLRPFRAAYRFGGFNGLTWMTSLGTPMVLLLEQLGASAFQVGLASSFVFTLYPLQVLATASLPRLGFRRQMVLAWSVRGLFLLVPLAIAFHAPDPPADWMANAVVLSVFGFCVCRAFGVVAQLPWFASVLPDEVRGRYFATEAAITSSVGVVTLLTCAGLFAVLPPWRAFAAIYGIGIFGAFAAVWNLSRIPAGPQPPPSPVREMGGEVLRLCLGPGLFRQYLVLTGVAAVVGSSFSAFAIYYLKSEAGIASSDILGFTAAQFGGQIVGTWAMRRWIDRVLIRRFFQLAQAILALVFAYWLGIVSGHTGWLAAVPLAFAVAGIALGISNAAHFTFVPELAPAEKRPVALAIFGAAAGILQGVAPMLWGLLLRAPGDAPGVDPTAFAVFFTAGIALCAVAFWLLQGLPDVRRTMVGRG